MYVCTLCISIYTHRYDKCARCSVCGPCHGFQCHQELDRLRRQCQKRSLENLFADGRRSSVRGNPGGPRSPIFRLTGWGKVDAGWIDFPRSWILKAGIPNNNHSWPVQGCQVDMSGLTQYCHSGITAWRSSKMMGPWVNLLVPHSDIPSPISTKTVLGLAVC